MKGFLQRRRRRNAAQDLLRHARHVRHMREDVLDPQVVRDLHDAEDRVHRQLRAAPVAMESDMEDLHAQVEAISPVRSHPGLRENLEVVVVAFAVAMCFRAYIVQPFKIPTGSMQPTLNGITYTNDYRPGITHRLPLKLVRVALFGEWYTERRAPASGTVTMHSDHDSTFLVVGGHRVKCDTGMRFFVKPGAYVERGDVLASGIRRTGDHLFVDKIAWNFRSPRRGEVMVFRTDDIKELDEKKTHYIKRMVGMPGEVIAIDPPRLLIDGRAVHSPESIVRIQEVRDGYSGYQLPKRIQASAIAGPGVPHQIGADAYFACGDNTHNSFDSRYWGDVPSRNLVGPAVFVYWPFRDHWGWIRNR